MVTAKSLRRFPGNVRLDIVLLRAARKLALSAIRSGIAEKFALGCAFLHRRHGTRLYGWFASIAHRHVDQTDFWDSAAKRFPFDDEFLRNKVHSALRAGRIADAESAFAGLLARSKLRATDSQFVVGFCNIDTRRGDSSRARDRLRQFLAGMRGRADYRVAALRLIRTIFAHFPRRGCCSESTDRLYDSFRVMLDRSGTRSGPKALLRRVCETEEMLQRQYECLFHTDILPQQRAAFVSLVRGRLSRGEAFSFIRVGDGEAACLPYEPALAFHAVSDAIDRERIWWGKPLGDELRDHLAPRIARAIWDADCIGIPPIARFVRELNLLREDTLEHSLTGRGLRAVLGCFEQIHELRSPGLAAPIFTSCHLHQDLALWNCYGSLLEGAGEVVVISCHPGIADWMTQHFNARIAGNIVLPPDNVSAPLLKRRIAAAGTLPETIESVLEQLGDLPRGRLVLIGAGYPGKLLISQARNRGGVALDLGSIFDYWLGLNTRSYLDLDPA